jgi:3-phenylpropionate/trans-cinnamate dioxygenase ferredoxin reductase subunit
VTVDRAPRRVLVVGAGVAGGTAALAVRDAGFDGEVIHVGAEPRHPYERPPQSKSFLRGELEGDRLRLRPRETWDERGIESSMGDEVVSIDPAAGEAVFADGGTVGFDRLVLATGARNRRLDAPGMDLEGVFDLRTVDDARNLREAATPGRRAVVVGMGFIGSEVAASLRALGVEVTAIVSGDAPLDRVLGPEVGGVLGAVHEERGVRLLRRARFIGFEGSGGSVRAAVTEDGRRVECDLAVVGVGVQPNVELAVAAGLRVQNGVVVDELCRASAPNVLAAGDVAAFPLAGADGHVRIEHFQHAVKHGRAAGLSAAGHGEPFTEIPWFWSEQYDQRVEYSGHHRTWDAFEVRGSLPGRSFLGFFCEGGVVRAVVSLNRQQELRRAMPAIGREVDPALLRDEDVDLREVAAAR